MPKKKNSIKPITAKEISDAFYDGVCHKKIAKMADKFLKQNSVPESVYSRYTRLDK
jgi:hypothetical protein